jgi:orotidine-5'-phosphate decarboxylase
MTTQLIEQIKIKKSFLAVGLDVDLDKIPTHLLELEDPIFRFNKSSVSTRFMRCLQTNIASLKPMESKDGWLYKTINYINDNYPDIFYHCRCETR